MSIKPYITVSSEIVCSYLPFSVREKVQRDLTIENPAYEKASMLGFSTWNISKDIKLYRYNSSAEIILPRGYGKRLISLLKREATSYDMDVSGILTLQEVEFNSIIELRDYQIPAIAAVKKNINGVIIKPCGSGKTITGLQICAELKQPVLWITHTKDLLNQSLSAAKTWLQLNENEYGTITNGKIKLGSKFTIATIQTLASIDLNLIKDKFGVIVIDECHHTYQDVKSAGQFYEVISKLPGKYRIGLTASEHRSDGLIETMFTTIGPKVYEVTQKQLKEAGKIITPTIEFVPSSYYFDKEEGKNLKFSSMLKDMCTDDDRNNLLLDYICNVKKDEYAIVLSDNLDHLQLLMNAVEKRRPELALEFISGKTKKSLREYALKNMQEKNSNILFATYKLAKEGLDIPHLSKLFFTTPKKDKAIIQQSIGRISRPAEDKVNATVYDFVDYDISTCIYQARNRMYEVYKPVGCKIINEHIVR